MCNKKNRWFLQLFCALQIALLYISLFTAPAAAEGTNYGVIVQNGTLDGDVQINNTIFQFYSYEGVLLSQDVIHDQKINLHINFREEVRGWSKKGGYQYALFGHYEQRLGANEPILWRILGRDEDRVLLVSENVLDVRSFNDYVASWPDTDMKQWLNEEFLTEAFDKAERSALAAGGKLGQVFLLSKNEVTNAAYGFSDDADSADSQRIAFGTRYAIDNGLDVQPNRNSGYYLRTDDSKTTYAQVRATGKIGSARYDRDNVGVRPAIWIDLNKAPFIYGNGTKESPYQVPQKVSTAKSSL